MSYPTLEKIKKLQEVIEILRQHGRDPIKIVKKVEGLIDELEKEAEEIS